MTVYGYLRVSTGGQTVETQRIGVLAEAHRRGLAVDEFVTDEGISGGVEYEKRRLGPLLERIGDGDVIIASEISRLGRTLFMVMRILDHCVKVGAKVYTQKDAFELGDNVQSKVLAFAFGLAAEIERKMISERTKEGLARARREGKVLGRPVGRKNARLKLDGQEDSILRYRRMGLSWVKVARVIGVDRATLDKFVKERMEI
ncbi:MAG: recombinase family protein [Kiritimatiellaeota bacterium]|nr:recombinase family protein [Kiritimatiellota bacterium]